MKRILIILLLTALCMIPNSVWAETYYTEYGPWKKVETPVENSELQEGKTEYQYQFYYFEKQFSINDYVVGKNPKEYPYQSDIKRKTDFSKWQAEVPEAVPNRETETKKVYRYQELEKISKITIVEADGSNDRLGLTEIEVLYQNELIPFTLECSECNTSLSSKLQNGIYYEQADFLYPHQELTIQLDRAYNPKDLEINVYVSDTIGTKDTSFVIKSSSQNQDVYILGKRKYRTVSSPGGAYKDQIQIRDIIQQPCWDETILESTTPLEENPYQMILDPIIYYRFRDTKYLYYKLVPIYLDGFHLTYPNYLCDESTKQSIFYQRTRDKIVVKDNIVLTKQGFTIDDVIEYSTIPIQDFKMQSNIDWNVSGSYQVTITYENQNINVPVTLSLPNNSSSSQTVKNVNKEEIKKEKKNMNSSTICLTFLFFVGLFLVVYSLEKIVDRKK